MLHRSKCPFTRKTRVELGEMAGERALNHLYYYGKKKVRKKKKLGIILWSNVCLTRKASRGLKVLCGGV